MTSGLRWLVIVCCVTLALTSLSTMVSDIAAHQATRQERKWQDGQPVNETDWIKAFDQLEFATWLFPWNPDYLQTQGRLAYWAAGSGDRLNLPPASSGIEPLRKSLRVRPQSPYAWADLALVKGMAGQYDQEFNQALRNAQKYGPWERPVLIRLLTTYFASWENLTRDQKYFAMQQFSHALSIGGGLEKQALILALSSPISLVVCERSADLVLKYRLSNLCAGIGVLRANN